MFVPTSVVKKSGHLCAQRFVRICARAVQHAFHIEASPAAPSSIALVKIRGYVHTIVLSPHCNARRIPVDRSLAHQSPPSYLRRVSGFSTERTGAIVNRMLVGIYSHNMGIMSLGTYSASDSPLLERGTERMLRALCRQKYKGAQKPPDKAGASNPHARLCD